MNDKFLWKLGEINFHVYRKKCKMCGNNFCEQGLTTVFKYKKTKSLFHVDSCGHKKIQQILSSSPTE